MASEEEGASAGLESRDLNLRSPDVASADLETVAEGQVYSLTYKCASIFYWFYGNSLKVQHSIPSKPSLDPTE